MPKVTIPPAYRGPTEGLAEVEVQGPTVLECLEQVEARYPGFQAQAMEKGVVHVFVKLIRNGDVLDRETALSTVLDPNDELEVFSAIAGG